MARKKLSSDEEKRAIADKLPDIQKNLDKITRSNLTSRLSLKEQNELRKAAGGNEDVLKYILEHGEMKGGGTEPILPLGKTSNDLTGESSKTTKVDNGLTKLDLSSKAEEVLKDTVFDLGEGTGKKFSTGIGGRVTSRDKPEERKQYPGGLQSGVSLPELQKEADERLRLRIELEKQLYEVEKERLAQEKNWGDKIPLAGKDVFNLLDSVGDNLKNLQNVSEPIPFADEKKPDRFKTQEEAQKEEQANRDKQQADRIRQQVDKNMSAQFEKSVRSMERDKQGDSARASGAGFNWFKNLFGMGEKTFKDKNTEAKEKAKRDKMNPQQRAEYDFGKKKESVLGPLSGAFNKGKSALTNPSELGGIGDVLGGAGKAASMIPGVGPAIGGVLKFGEAVFKSVDKLKEWNNQLHQANMRFSEFSGEMAKVGAESEVRQIEMDMIRGKERSESAKNLAESKDRLEKSLMPMENAFANLKNNIATTFNYMLVGMGRTLTGEQATKEEASREGRFATKMLKNLGKISDETAKRMDEALKNMGEDEAEFVSIADWGKLGADEAWHEAYGRPGWDRR